MTLLDRCREPAMRHTAEANITNSVLHNMFSFLYANIVGFIVPSARRFVNYFSLKSEIFIGTARSFPISP